MGFVEGFPFFCLRGVIVFLGEGRISVGPCWRGGWKIGRRFPGFQADFFELGLTGFGFAWHNLASAVGNSMTFRKEASMDRSDHRDFFLQPDQPVHRRYEALRAIVVENRPLQEVAAQFGVSYGTVRNWHSQFLKDRRDGAPPPFS